MQEFWDAHASLDGWAWSHDRYLDMLKPSIRGKRVLELGCGSGNLAARLAQSALSVTAIDFSEGMLELGRARHGHIPNLSFVSGDIVHLDLAEQFDVVCGIFVLHEIKAGDYPEFIAALKRHMAPQSFAFFQENSFFNPMFRFVRRHLVGRHLGIPKFGSIDETPFDAERLGLLRRSFRYCRRSAEVFVLFGRVHGYLIRSRRFGPMFEGLDRRVSRLALPDLLKRNFSYVQHIYVSDSTVRMGVD